MHTRSLRAVAGAAALLLLGAACGDDEAEDAATDTTAAAPEEAVDVDAFCAAVDVLANAELPTEAQLDAYEASAPAELQDEIDTAFPVFVEALATGDFEPLGEPEVLEATESMRTVEADVCGVVEGEEGDDEGAGATVDVTALDYRYDGLPATVAPGTVLALRNGSATELHELVAFRLPDDEARSAEELLALPDEELEGVFAGEPALVAIAMPGEDGEAVVGDGALAEEGRYLLACAIPTGADPAAYLAAAEAAGDGPPEVAGGPPHFTQGMFAELVVG